jgi:hypothetical protein
MQTPRLPSFVLRDAEGRLKRACLPARIGSVVQNVFPGGRTHGYVETGQLARRFSEFAQ